MFLFHSSVFIQLSNQNLMLHTSTACLKPASLSCTQAPKRELNRLSVILIWAASSASWKAVLMSPHRPNAETYTLHKSNYIKPVYFRFLSFINDWSICRYTCTRTWNIGNGPYSKQWSSLQGSVFFQCFFAVRNFTSSGYLASATHFALTSYIVS